MLADPRLWPFVMLLLLAAGWDLASYTIPNLIPAVLLAASCCSRSSWAHAGASGQPCIAAAIGLALGFALFAFG